MLHGSAVNWLLARSDARGVTDWYLTDRLGSVQALADAQGAVRLCRVGGMGWLIASTPGSST